MSRGHVAPSEAARTDLDIHGHWEHVYQSKAADQVSWFQPTARVSLELIKQAAPAHAAAIIDVGGGASTLVDGLLAAGYRALTVLDVSETALAITRRRIGEAAAHVTWLRANVLDASLPSAAFDLWHDRAVFHFLTAAGDRQRYVSQVRHAVRPGDHVLMATFAEDGPTRCSGLDVARYSADELHAQFGAGFELITSRRDMHRTPSGAEQAFTYCVFRFASPVAAP